MTVDVKKVVKAKKVIADHPTYADMIKHAVKELKERNGSSRQAIVKYIRANYKVDDKAESHIRRALVSGTKSGKLMHTKGTGASGSFKLAEKSAIKVASVKTAKPAVKKVKTPKKAVKVVKKTSTPKLKKAVKSPKPKAMKAKKTPKKTMKPKKPVVKKTPKKVVKK